ncbi:MULTISPECIES: transglutaminaseTgpA domain-containing protein [Bacteria]|uniref:transglutaminase family protein n=1 Tax=Bacteria TaxID=2 RepID=UPI003C7B86B5
MSGVDGEPQGPRGTGPVGIAVLTGLSVLVAMWPLSGVILPGRWSIDIVAVSVGVLTTGLLVRLLLRRRGPVLRIMAVLCVQAAAGVAVLTFLEFRPQSLLGLLPSPEAFSAVPSLFATAGQEMYFGTAPLDPSRALAVVLAIGAGALTISLDLMIGVGRLPLVALLLVALVGIIPSTAVPGPGVDVVWFVALALLLLVLLRVRVEDPGAVPPAPADHVGSASPSRARPAATLAIGAAAIAVAVAVTPLLPVSSTGIVLGGTSTALTPSLRLGEDLRRPRPAPALTLLTDGSSAPYLRIATLSAFDGSVWQPDEEETAPLADGFAPVTASAGIAIVPSRTTIRTTGVSGGWLPVPYQATSVRGLDGSWETMGGNRTVVARGADAADQNYTVEAASVLPTQDQIVASTATDVPGMDAYRALPEQMPPTIAQTAAEIAGTGRSDYERLLSLQTWFRSAFTYSLDTPVEEGFDGTGADAVARFLDRRAGYCVHFAGAFALMARSLGMPTRIVVGYLPGTATDERQQGRPVYLVMSDQLHSWPEVYFEGLGWIPFEPTATLGSPTRFAAAAAGVGEASPSASPDAPTAAATTAPRASAPSDRTERDPGASGTAPQRTLDLPPVLGAMAGIVAVLLLPAATRAVLRALRRGRVRRGDTLAAWAEVRDTLRDLGLPASAAESPRARGDRLVHGRGVDPVAVRVLIRAVERASYARPDGTAPSGAAPEGTALDSAVRRIRADLLRGASGRDRVRAALVPRSLFGGRLAPASTA